MGKEKKTTTSSSTLPKMASLSAKAMENMEEDEKRGKTVLGKGGASVSFAAAAFSSSSFFQGSRQKGEGELQPCTPPPLFPSLSSLPSEAHAHPPPPPPRPPTHELLHASFSFLCYTGCPPHSPYSNTVDV